MVYALFVDIKYINSTIWFVITYRIEPGKAGTEIFTVNGLLFSVFVFTSTAAVWLLVIKPALQKNKQLVDKNYSLLRFKKNPDIFNALLSKQKKVDTTPFENDYQLGNPDACLQIMVVCNPYCSPCAKAHEILHELVKKNDIGLTVRFSIKADNKEDKGTQAVEYILQLLSDNPNVNKRQILHDWYKVMDLEKFRHQYLLGNKGDVDVLLRLQDQWVEGAKIQFTPTIFINGYELPKQYRVNDLKWVVEKEEKLPETGKIEKTKIMH